MLKYPLILFFCIVATTFVHGQLFYCEGPGLLYDTNCVCVGQALTVRVEDSTMSAPCITMLSPGGRRIWYIFDRPCYSYITTFDCPGIEIDSFIGDSFTVLFHDTGFYELGVRTVDSANNVIAGVFELGDYFCVIYCPPVSHFTASVSDICAGDCVQYTDSSGGYPMSWLWYFQGGEPATYTGHSPPQVCYTDTGTYTTMQVAIGRYSSDTSYSTVHVRDCGSCLCIPDAFTPNGDGKNDIYHVFTFCQFPDFHISIFDRWGEMVYSSDDISQGWDGTYRGAACPAGVYIYSIKAGFDYGGLTESREGSITLIR